MREIHAYSLARDGDARVARNFRVREFACSDGSDPVMIAPLLAVVLQAIRGVAGRAVTITSAYRTPGHNAKEGGAEQSQHLYGLAADIVVAGMAPREVAAIARDLMPDWGGVGIYAQKGFTHIDVREDRADWEG